MHSAFAPCHLAAVGVLVRVVFPAVADAPFDSTEGDSTPGLGRGAPNRSALACSAPRSERLSRALPHRVWRLEMCCPPACRALCREIARS